MSKQAKVYVKIANPRDGEPTHIKRSKAERAVLRGEAKFDHCSRLVWLFDPAVLARKTNGYGPLMINAVTEFCGLDAFPGRPVMPPSPMAIDRMRSYRGPVRPPLRRSA